MERLIYSVTIFASAANFFFMPNVYAGSCSSHMNRNAEVECLSSDKKCLDKKNKENLIKVEV